MQYKYKYEIEEEKLNILAEHSDLVLIEEQNITEGNFLIFIDSQTQQENQEAQELNSRVLDLSIYLSNSDNVTVSNIENSILEIEKNKVINGGI